LFALLQGAGQHVGEPVVQLPLLPEYEEQLKSDVADIKNIGSGYAGAITAALFLKRFTDFPWMHIDLSMALTASATHYRTAGGTGAGLRLLWHFLQSALKK
jgi:leucyl aminopeptidase